MKNLFLSVLTLISIIEVSAQQSPTISNPSSLVQNGGNDRAFWSRAGNTQQLGSNNIFGTRWNSGIYTITNGQYRMKLNGSVNYDVNGYNGNRDGYLLLGTSMSTNYLSAIEGAYSLLHLNGPNTSINQMPRLGYRPWMQTGVTITDNADLAYFGLRKLGSGVDKTETVICWSNDGELSSSGPDDLVFRFTNGGFDPFNPIGGVVQGDLTNERDLDGRHVARFTNGGLMGLGNTFGLDGPTTGNPAGLYARPQSLLHLSFSDNSGIWSQYTNRGNSAGTTQGT